MNKIKQIFKTFSINGERFTSNLSFALDVFSMGLFFSALVITLLIKLPSIQVLIDMAVPTRVKPFDDAVWQIIWYYWPIVELMLTAVGLISLSAWFAFRGVRILNEASWLDDIDEEGILDRIEEMNKEQVPEA